MPPASLPSTSLPLNQTGKVPNSSKNTLSTSDDEPEIIGNQKGSVDIIDEEGSQGFLTPNGSDEENENNDGVENDTLNLKGARASVHSIAIPVNKNHHSVAFRAKENDD